MLQEISYFLIFGRPVLMYLGAATLILLLATATVGFLYLKGKEIPFGWHVTLARCTILVALVHASLGFLAYV